MLGRGNSNKTYWGRLRSDGLGVMVPIKGRLPRCPGPVTELDLRSRSLSSHRNKNTDPETPFYFVDK